MEIIGILSQALVPGVTIVQHISHLTSLFIDIQFVISHFTQETQTFINGSSNITLCLPLISEIFQNTYMG